MSRYEKYKATNIEWIGEIPEHWQVKKLKYIGESIIGITYSPDDISDEENGLLVLRSSNIQDGKLAFEDCVYVSKDVKEKHLTKEGDVLLCARNGSAHLVGKSALIKKENTNITWGAFMSIFRSSIGEFAYQFFNSQIFKSQTGLFATSTINQLTTDTLNNLFVPLPLPEEQTAIANYLNEKTAHIDKLIANKQWLIELLEEEKTAIINYSINGVGKGWKRKKLKYVTSINSESLSEKTDENYSLRYIDIGSVDANGNIHSITDYLFAEAPSRARRIVKEGDTILSTVRTYLKAIALIDDSNGNAICSTGFAVIRPLQELNSKFLFFICRSQKFIDAIISYSKGVSYPSIDSEDLKNIEIEYPSLEIQTEIVESILSTSEPILKTIEKIKREIAYMQEFKASLISEVVTGKQKVVN
ncbi:MAG: restriction endonuclease subunit S [Verrucomicrobia bacterium]|nr:restriction endonuclease subunit S [Verrucomicrobiota bacterium]MBX2919736.1 restriction endonuclease subunit S [Ferruginibacter sp.]